VVDASRRTATIEAETPFGKLPGKSQRHIIDIAINIFERLRYVDVDGTFRALLYLYNHEQDARQRDNIARVVRELSEYNLHIWEKVGPGVQMALSESIYHLDSAERFQSRALLLTAWRELLSPDLKGTSFGAATVTLSRSAIAAIDEVKKIRRKAIEGAFEILDQVTSEHDKMLAINAVRAANQLPSRASYSNELCALVIADTRYLAEELTQRIDPPLPSACSYRELFTVRL
jgi:hypothetical protein